MMKLIRFCVVMCGLLAVTCCTIKEDRADCPCRLFLDMSEVDKETVEYAAVFLTGSDGFVFNDTIESKSFSKGYFVDIPRGSYEVWVSYGAGESGVGPEGIVVKSGEEFPDIYMYHSHIDASGDSVREKVDLNKNYCNITVCVYAADDFPFRLVMRGNVNGYCADGSLSEGDFNFEMSLGDNASCDVSVPRQSDDSLRLEVSDETGVLRVFALGEYIAASGYDWTARDLRDLTVSLDYSLTSVTVVMEGWDNEYHYSVVL